MKSRHPYVVSSIRYALLTWGFASVVYACTSGSFLVRADGWTRSRPIGTFPPGEVHVEPFMLDVWSGDGIHVSGLCAYYNSTPHSVDIDGRETSSGEFYPDVIYEISHGDGDWETLEVPTNNPGKQLTITVEARTRSRPLRINLDMFVPLIGKAKYGRLVLKTGEKAVFRVDELQPPSENVAE
jgi:hypothetical protein